MIVEEEKSPTMDNMKADDIPNFYRNKTVFVTGVSGFLGHVLVAKIFQYVNTRQYYNYWKSDFYIDVDILFSSCPDIAKMYILLREKRNKKVSERIREIFQSVVRCTFKAMRT
jgi:FlaA1/EpsC-like NDP-sugar epimerase